MVTHSASPILPLSYHHHPLPPHSALPSPHSPNFPRRPLPVTVQRVSEHHLQSHWSSPASVPKPSSHHQPSPPPPHPASEPAPTSRTLPSRRHSQHVNESL